MTKKIDANTRFYIDIDIKTKKSLAGIMAQDLNWSKN